MTGPDPLEDALVRPPHLDDHGFTEGVMARLPAPRPRRRLAVLAPFFAATAVLAAVVLPRALEAIALALARTAGPAVAWALPAIALAAAGAALAAALRADGRPDAG